MIRHGRRLCTARDPACHECPLLRRCPHGKRLTGRTR
jgi:endonuclease III